jgi:hypothetical protein
VLLIHVLRETFAGRYTGAWLQADEFGQRALYVAVVGAASADTLTAESAAGQIPDAIPVRLVSSVYTDDRLIDFLETINRWLAANGVTGIGLEIRPDPSKIVASVSRDLPKVAMALRGLLPTDALLINSTEPTNRGWAL